MGDFNSVCSGKDLMFEHFSKGSLIIPVMVSLGKC